MCGITGMVFQNGVERNAATVALIRFLFNELVTETQERGKDATGVVSFKRNGEYEWYKSPVTAREITTDDDAWAGIVSRIDNGSASLISHTRWSTKGSPKNNSNNHPFEIGNIIGVHNGTLTNDDQLFKQFGFKREGEVDSEVIFHLINKYNENEVTYEGLKEALEDSKLKGLFAIVFANKNQPNLVHIVKQEKPMTLAYWEEAGLVVYNSQTDLIENAFATLKRAHRNLWGFELDMTVNYREMKDDTYLTIDANGQDLDSMISDTQKICILSSSTKTTYYSSGWTKNDSCGTGSSTTNTRLITARDSINRVIEGELDEVTGEIIIYTSSMLAGASSDDGPEEGEEEVVKLECFECLNELDADEINAAYNAHNPPKERVCKACYAHAMEAALGS